LLLSAKPRQFTAAAELMPDWPLAVARSVCRGGDYSRCVKLNISGASGSFVAWLLADLLHLIGGGIVGSMPSSRTQQQTADLFQAAGAQESGRTQAVGRRGAGPAFCGYPP